MSKLLINEPPLQVLPTLAKEIGLNEAIALQQLHYWMSHGIWHKGSKWVYKPIYKWQQQDFPFWSERTVRNVFASLKKQNLIFVEKLNSNKQVRVNYYSINKSELKKITDRVDKVNKINDWAILAQCIWQHLPLPFGKSYHFHSVKLTSCMWQEVSNVKENNKETNKENNKETTDAVDVSFEAFYPTAKQRLKTSGVIPVFAEYDEDYFKPEVYKFCAWFAERKLNSNQRLYKLTEWFAKFTAEEKKRFYITEEPKHCSYQEFEQEAEPEMTLEEQRKALQAVFGGSNNESA